MTGSSEVNGRSSDLENGSGISLLRPTLSLSLFLSFHTLCVYTLFTCMHVLLLLCYTCTITHAKNKQEKIRVLGRQTCVELPMTTETRTTAPSQLKKNFFMRQGTMKVMTFRIQSMKLGGDSIIPLLLVAILLYQPFKPPQAAHLLHLHPPHPHNTISCPQSTPHASTKPNVPHKSTSATSIPYRSKKVSENDRSPLSDLLNQSLGTRS